MCMTRQHNTNKTNNHSSRFWRCCKIVPWNNLIINGTWDAKIKLKKKIKLLERWKKILNLKIIVKSRLNIWLGVDQWEMLLERIKFHWYWQQFCSKICFSELNVNYFFRTKKQRRRCRRLMLNLSELYQYSNVQVCWK